MEETKEEIDDILIVDNSTANRRNLVVFLNELGFETVVEATDGIEAFNYLNQHDFKLVITEINLPKMDGIELLKSIKISDLKGHVPVFVCGKDTSEDIVKQAIGFQANGFLQKPIDKEKLKALIESTFNLKNKKLNTDMQILVVDDVLSARKVARKTLKKLGFQNIIEVKSAREAVKEVLKKEIDLILTDWCMPEIDGNELIKMLKSKDETKDIPVIMVSSFSDNNKIIEATKSGAKGFIAKPYGVEVLKQRILEVFS